MLRLCFVVALVMLVVLVDGHELVLAVHVWKELLVVEDLERLHVRRLALF